MGVPNCYPIFLRLEKKLCLVVGGGEVACRKIHSLLSCGAKVRVVSPCLVEALQPLVQAKDIEYRQDMYHEKYLEGVFLVIAATGDSMVNKQVAADCHERNLLLNAVDDPSNGNFFVPAVMRRGALQIAISTDGKSPLLARKIRETLECMYGTEFGPLVDLLGDIREEILHTVSDEQQRRRLLASILDEETMQLIRKGDFSLAKERIINASSRGRCKS